MGTKGRRRIWWALGPLLALAGLSGVLLEASRAPCFTLAGSITCRVRTSQPMVALTFDDGPTSRGLDAALPALARAGAHATFFAIGSQVAAHPDLVRRIVAAGDEVGNHSWSHHRMVLHSTHFYDEEIVRTDVAIRAAGAPQPLLFRAPYTKKLIGLPLAVARHHERLIGAEIVDPPGVTDPRTYATQIVREARPGSIILMHLMSEGNSTAREALPLVLDGLRRRGFRSVTVGELMAHSQG